MAQTASKYAEVGQTTAVCCNACRACVTTNLVGLGLGFLAATGAALAGFARRLHA